MCDSAPVVRWACARGIGRLHGQSDRTPDLLLLVQLHHAVVDLLLELDAFVFVALGLDHAVGDLLLDLLLHHGAQCHRVELRLVGGSCALDQPSFAGAVLHGGAEASHPVLARRRGGAAGRALVPHGRLGVAVRVEVEAAAPAGALGAVGVHERVAVALLLLAEVRRLLVGVAVLVVVEEAGLVVERLELLLLVLLLLRLVGPAAVAVVVLLLAAHLRVVRRGERVVLAAALGEGAHRLALHVFAEVGLVGRLLVGDVRDQHVRVAAHVERAVRRAGLPVRQPGGADHGAHMQLVVQGALRFLRVAQLGADVVDAPEDGNAVVELFGLVLLRDDVRDDALVARGRAED